MTDTVDPVSPAEIDILRAMEGLHVGPAPSLDRGETLEALHMLVACGHVAIERWWEPAEAAGATTVHARYTLTDTGRAIIEGMT